MRTAKTDQTGWMPRLIWVFAGRTLTLLVLSRGGSYSTNKSKHMTYAHIFYSLKLRLIQKLKLFSEENYEPPHDKINKMACANSEDSDQPGHLPSLIWVFAIRMKKALVLSYRMSAQWRLWSDWADAQAGRMPRLIWVFAGCTWHFVGFVIWRLLCPQPRLLQERWLVCNQTILVRFWHSKIFSVISKIG